jgi:hypothetical protein
VAGLGTAEAVPLRFVATKGSEVFTHPFTDAKPSRLHGVILIEQLDGYMEERIVFQGGPSGTASFLALSRRRSISDADKQSQSK